MTTAAVKETTEAIRGLVCRTMPTTAAASGLVSAVDHTESANKIVDDHFEEMVLGVATFHYGLSRVQAWLDFRGLPSGADFARLVKFEGVRRVAAKESREALIADAHDAGDEDKAAEVQADYDRLMKDKFRLRK